jgi:methylthioribose-1-phosphate isomerase
MPEEKYNPLKIEEYHPLKHLYALRHIDTDVVPKEIVYSTNPNNLLKVRGAWWAGVAGDLGIAVDEDLIQNAQLRRRIGRFVTKVGKLKFGDDTPASRRTAEEIKWANEFIDKVLEQTGYANVLLDLSSLETSRPAPL